MKRRFRDFDQLLSVVAKEAKNRPFCLAYAPGATHLDVIGPMPCAALANLMRPP